MKRLSVFICVLAVLLLTCSKKSTSPDSTAPNEHVPFSISYTADPDAAANPSNTGRLWDGQRLVAADAPADDDRLPFSVAPKEKMDARAIMAVLRSHYEHTPRYAIDSASGCPHGNSISTICNGETQTSFVAELRGDMPSDIGLVYWVCLSSPCASCYIPFYYGTPAFPTAYTGDSIVPSEDEYRVRTNPPFAVDTTSAFWTFTAFRYHVELRYRSVSAGARGALDRVESQTFAGRAAVEQQVLSLLGVRREEALRVLNDYSLDVDPDTLEAQFAQMRAEALHLLDEHSLEVYHDALKAMREVTFNR